MKRKHIVKRWLLMQKFHTKNLFTLLLAITGCLLLVSIYFINIFGVPNGSTTSVSSSISLISSISDNQYDDDQTIIKSNSVLIVNDNHNNNNKNEDDDYYTSAISYKNNEIKQQQQKQEKGQWWQWNRYLSSSPIQMIKSWNFQKDGLISRFKQFRNNDLDKDVKISSSIITKQIDETLFVNNKKRIRSIQNHLDQIFDNIKSNRKQKYCQVNQQLQMHYISNLESIPNDNNRKSSCNIIVIESLQSRTIIKKHLRTIFSNKSSNQFLFPRLLFNHFEELNPLLVRNELPCQLFDLFRTYSLPKTLQYPLAPLCFQLPQMFQKFIDVSDALGNKTNWTLEYGNGKSSDNESIRINEPLHLFSPIDRNHLIQINRIVLKQQLHSSKNLINNNLGDDNDYVNMKRFLPPILIKQHLIQQVVHYLGQPIKLRIFILITSINPFRALQYKQGLVLTYRQQQSQNDSNEPLDTLETFWNKKFSNDFNAKYLAQNSIHQALLFSLLLLEVNEHLLSNIPNMSSKITETESNQYESDWPEIIPFQWLAFDLVLQHSDTVGFQSFVVDVFSLKQLKNQNISKQFELINQLESDTRNFFHLKFLNRNFNKTIEQIQKKLKPMLIDKDEFGLLDINCHISHSVCLSQTDFDYIVDTVEEFEQIKHQQFRSFESIYPMEWNQWNQLESIRFLFEQILLHLDVDGENQQQSQLKQFFEYKTERLHPVMEILFAQWSILSDNQTQIFPSLPTTSSNEVFENVDHHDLTNLNWTGQKTRLLIPLMVDGNNDNRLPSSVLSQQSTFHKCSIDPNQITHLHSLEIVDCNNAQLKPKFNPFQFHYQLTDSINYQQMLIKIRVQVEHCDTWLQLDNHFFNIQYGVLNFSLGLGDNHINLKLVNGNASHEPISIYTIVIHRRNREEQYSKSSNYSNLLDFGTNQLEICSLIQDCDLHIYPTLECGWKSTNKTCNQEEILLKTWTDKLSSKSFNNECKNGAQNGRWLVPCRKCDQEQTCLWRELQWLPYDCHYKIPMESNNLIQCLSNKNILMIGDSTNRGIMHYILERLNRTLTEADKTHDYKTYNLMDYDTKISFVYYPKFWVPPNQRPSFEQIFHNSLQTLLSVENSTVNLSSTRTIDETIVIIGGVQWISKQHLHIAQEQFKKLNLNPERIRLVVKTLGSGFHQSVIGVHYMPVNEQIKLAAQNQQLIDEALNLNIEVIDTFNKTISMFKDFYPGKCACHFHKIIKEKFTGSSFPNNIKDSIHYHVDGYLNRLYSEILLSRICNKKNKQ